MADVIGICLTALKGDLAGAKEDLFGYRTVKLSRIKEPRLGVAFRILQLAVFVYIIGFKLVS